MKVLFLDIDGVLNRRYTLERYRGLLGIDRELLAKLRHVIEKHDVKVVLSSTWRLFDHMLDHVKEHLPIYGVTPHLPAEDRGVEIKRWLSEHPDVLHYAIIDDDADMLPEQQRCFFRTNTETGLTLEIAAKLDEHFSATKSTQTNGMHGFDCYCEPCREVKRRFASAFNMGSLPD